MTMAMTARQYRKELENIIERYTSNYSITLTNGGHYKITLRHKDDSRFVFAGGTNSDRRVLQNIAADVRRTWLQLRG
jgi:hypothetical protein